MADQPPEPESPESPKSTQSTESQAAAPSRQPVERVPMERVPVMQRILDNHFLLLFLGVAMPTVFYLMWGILEVAQIPIAPR